MNVAAKIPRHIGISVLRPVAAGPWNIQAYPEHTNVALGLPVTNVVLKAAQRYTAYAIGNLGGTDQYAAKFILVPGLTSVKGGGSCETSMPAIRCRVTGQQLQDALK